MANISSSAIRSSTFRPLIITFAAWFAALVVSYGVHRWLEIMGA